MSKKKDGMAGKLNGNKLKNAFARLVYMPDGSFSMTRIMMVITFMSAILLIWIGIISGLMGKKLPDNIYGYVAGLTGGGIVQYGLTKVVNVRAGGSTEEASEEPPE